MHMCWVIFDRNPLELNDSCDTRTEHNSCCSRALKRSIMPSPHTTIAVIANNRPAQEGQHGMTSSLLFRILRMWDFLTRRSWKENLKKFCAKAFGLLLKEQRDLLWLETLHFRLFQRNIFLFYDEVISNLTLSTFHWQKSLTVRFSRN